MKDTRFVNGLLLCSSYSTLRRLQRVQDAATAVRLLCGVSPWSLLKRLAGCQCQAEYTSNYARWCTASNTASPRNTSQNSASTATTDNCDQASVATSRSVEPGCVPVGQT